MKLVVFSDSHGNISNMERIIEKERPELVLHLGDMCRDIEEVQYKFPRQTIQNVCGNCDGFTQVPDRRILRVEGKRILMMHGHRYNVKQTYGPAAYAAREAQADILLFGHTHIPYCEQVDGLWMLNPGSCRGRGATYGIISLENKGILCYTVKIAPKE